MLKRTVSGELWCISQPDHAAAAGYLAAHWGNGQFARPGRYAPFPDPERLRAETVLAIAEHDNGWWEWEADPQIDPADGLPLDLTSLEQSDGLQRWRLGVSGTRIFGPRLTSRPGGRRAPAGKSGFGSSAERMAPTGPGVCGLRPGHCPEMLDFLP